MFSTGPDGDLCRNWRNYELEQVHEGDLSDALNYDNLCTTWSNKYPWLPECACMKRNDPVYGDPYYRQVASGMKQATPNDGCWYIPCMDSNIDRMLIQSHEDIPQTGECDSACVQIINTVNSNDIDYSGVNMTCEINETNDDDDDDDDDIPDDDIPDDDDEKDKDDDGGARLTDKQKKELGIGLGIGAGVIVLAGVGIFVAAKLTRKKSPSSSSSAAAKTKAPK